MKTEKILVFTDTNKQAQFETEVENVQHEAFRLISAFEAFQRWEKISNVNQFESLCSNPIQAMNQVLQNNSGINLKAYRR